MKKALIVCALFMVSTTLIRCARGPSGGESPEIGRTAPGFKLPDLSGREVSLEQYRGKIVILDFWATWCGPCRMTMPVLERLQREYSSDMALLAINLAEPPDMVRDFVREQRISSTVLLDEDGSVGEVYRSESIPMQVLIDRNGVIRDVSVGYSPSLASKLRSQIEKIRGSVAGDQ